MIMLAWRELKSAIQTLDSSSESPKDQKEAESVHMTGQSVVASIKGGKPPQEIPNYTQFSY